MDSKISTVEGRSNWLPQGDRYAYLEREHWNTAAALLAVQEENEESDAAEVDEIKQMAACNGKVLMIWKELGVTIANYLGYDENKADVEEDSEPVFRQGPRKEMGPRFKELYAEHFVVTNVPYETAPPPSKCTQNLPLQEESSGSESDADDLGWENVSETLPLPQQPMCEKQLTSNVPSQKIPTKESETSFIQVLTEKYPVDCKQTYFTVFEKMYLTCYEDVPYLLPFSPTHQPYPRYT
jgi:hypothetical protein